MSRNEDVTTAIWVDPDFAELSPDAKLVYLWSFTNGHNGMSGVYKIRTAQIGFETGLDMDKVASALEELSDAGLAFYEEQVMFVRARVKRLRTKSSQIAKSVVKDVSQLRADHPLRGRFLDVYRDERWLRDALSDAGMLSLNRGSGEVHKKSDKQGDSVSLTGTSPEVPLSGTGLNTSREDVGLPESFPRELEPHLAIVVGVLSELAARKANAKAVRRRAVALVMTPKPHKPFVSAAYDCAAYWDERQLRDPVAAYRNWLKNVDELAGFEQLGSSDDAAGAKPRRSVTHLPESQRPTDDHKAQIAAHLARQQQQQQHERGAA